MSDTELVFQRFDDGTVAIIGSAPTFTTMTWDFVRYSDPDLVSFDKDTVTFIEKVTYLIRDINLEGTFDLELLVDNR